jgi:hypothetical protein
VVQTLYSDYTTNEKDVDGGLGYEYIHEGKKLFLPILVNEDKGGHFCSTTASNVNSISRKFKDLNFNIVTMTTTDNHITIGKDKDYDFMKHTNILFSIRGVNNLNHKNHSTIIGSRFSEVENSLISYLNMKSISDFNFDNLKIQNKKNKTIRENIDNGGLLIKY